MTEAEALRLVHRLGQAFPRQQLQPETAAIYAEELADLDADRARDAVREIVRESRWFPTIAEIREKAKRPPRLSVLIDTFDPEKQPPGGPQ